MARKRQAKKDIVVIYEDPFTRQKIEGKAELIRFIGFDEYPKVGRYLVHFVGDPPKEFVERIIITEDSQA